MVKLGIIASPNLAGGGLYEMLAERFASLVGHQAQADSELVLLTTLELGPPRLLAQQAIAMAARFDAVIPFAGYAESFEHGEARTEYQRLVGRARQIQLMPFDSPSYRAYEAAYRWMIDAADLIVIVWDGAAHTEVSEALAYAQRRNAKTIVIDQRTGAQSFVGSGARD